MLMGSLIFLGLMIILVAGLMDTAGKCSRAEEECMRKGVGSMSKYKCGRPEWADNEECPIETGEVKDCAECYWGKEQEDE